MRFLEIILCKKRKGISTSNNLDNIDNHADEVQVLKVPIRSRKMRKASKQNKLKKKYVYFQTHLTRINLEKLL